MLEKLQKMCFGKDQIEMGYVLQWVNEIGTDGFTPIPVEYCTDNIYLFKGWPED